jgi:hypothetical protein
MAIALLAKDGSGLFYSGQALKEMWLRHFA